MKLINRYTAPRKRQTSWLRQTNRRPSSASMYIGTFGEASLAVCPQVSVSAVNADQPGGQSP